MTNKTLVLIWLGHYIAAWLDVVCGLTNIVTFCAYRPWWDFTFRAYWSNLMLKQKFKNINQAMDKINSWRQA